MGAPGFLNENEFRDYPFTADRQFSAASADAVVLPESAVVDFGAMMGVDTGYLEDEHYVYLYRISRQSDQLLLEFRTTAPGANNAAVVFTRSVAAPEFEIEYVDAAADGGSSSQSGSDACGQVPLWDAFLITGQLTELVQLLPEDGDTLYFVEQQWQIEPSLVRSLSQTFLGSLNLGNYARTRVTPAASCDSAVSLSSDDHSSSAAATDAPVFVNARCLTGSLRFKEGYNCVLRQDNRTNTITISAAVGAGAGQACSEVPLYADEGAPAGSILLSGGPACDQVINTINGVGGSVVRLLAGQGFQITDDPANNTVHVALTLTNFAACLQPDG